MIYKEDAAAAQERMEAWWNHELIDRPAFAYMMPREGRSPGAYWDNWYLAQHVDAFDEVLELWEKGHASTLFGAEQFPLLWINYGPGVLASVLGATAEFKTDTVWFSRPTSLDEVVAVLESAQLNMNNAWYARLVHATERASERGRGNFHVGTTDLGGILDVLASFLSPRDIFYAMKARSGVIDACRAIILEKWHKVYDALTAITLQHCHSTSAWLGLWDAKRWYPLQCDFAYMLSPKWFTRYVLPDIATQTERLDHAIYHLDGVRQLPFLNELLGLPRLTGIQWVPGDGKPQMGADEWTPVYKKIQAAGKNIVAGTSPGLAAKMYRELDPRGLYVSTHYGSQIWADFYLPPFLGGMGGIDEEDA